MEYYRNLFDRIVRDCSRATLSFPEDLYPMIPDKVLLLDIGTIPSFIADSSFLITVRIR